MHWYFFFLYFNLKTLIICNSVNKHLIFLTWILYLNFRGSYLILNLDLIDSFLNLYYDIFFNMFGLIFYNVHFNLHSIWWAFLLGTCTLTFGNLCEHFQASLCHTQSVGEGGASNVWHQCVRVPWGFCCMYSFWFQIFFFTINLTFEPIITWTCFICFHRVRFWQT